MIPKASFGRSGSEGFSAEFLRVAQNPPKSPLAHLVHRVSTARFPRTPSEPLLSTRLSALESPLEDLEETPPPPPDSSTHRRPTPRCRRTSSAVLAFSPVVLMHQKKQQKMDTFLSGTLDE